LSYQAHEQRAENWVVVTGEALVLLDDQQYTVRIGEHIFIPQRSKHRLCNPGKKLLQVIETQTGKYFGEDDIVRYADDYQR
jgi:mannose-6-phosphate isomerase-like protein (cupin superfamily)